jgi:hypothetical protein
MAFMYIPPPYCEEKYDQFTILHDGRFYICKKYWSVIRGRDGHFTIFIQERCRQFIIMMKLSVFDIRVGLCRRLVSYALDVCTRREYRHMVIYLRFYCNKLKHRPYYEVKDVIMKHFLRLGIYLNPSVFQLIIFFHSFSPTFANNEIRDDDLQTIRQYRQRLLTLSQPAIFFTTSDILIELFYNVNISARIHPPLKQRTPLKS